MRLRSSSTRRGLFAKARRMSGGSFGAPLVLAAVELRSPSSTRTGSASVVCAVAIEPARSRAVMPQRAKFFSSMIRRCMGTRLRRLCRRTRSRLPAGSLRRILAETDGKHGGTRPPRRMGRRSRTESLAPDVRSGRAVERVLRTLRRVVESMQRSTDIRRRIETRIIARSEPSTGPATPRDTGNQANGERGDTVAQRNASLTLRVNGTRKKGRGLLLAHVFRCRSC